jgi:hypothetical protein
VFGGAPYLVLHPQNILLSVLSWTWTSSPMVMRKALVARIGMFAIF